MERGKKKKKSRKWREIPLKQWGEDKKWQWLKFPFLKKKETEQLRADIVRKLLGKLSHQARDAAQIPESLLVHSRSSQQMKFKNSVSSCSSERSGIYFHAAWFNVIWVDLFPSVSLLRETWILQKARGFSFTFCQEPAFCLWSYIYFSLPLFTFSFIFLALFRASKGWKRNQCLQYQTAKGREERKGEMTLDYVQISRIIYFIPFLSPNQQKKPGRKIISDKKKSDSA